MTRLVIFDCDGVLVESETIANRILAHYATDMGWPMDMAGSLATFKGMTMGQVDSAIRRHIGKRTPLNWLEDFERDCAVSFRREIMPVEGIAALIQSVHRRGLLSCVASQGSHEKMQVTLGAAGLLEVFEGRIYSAADVGRPKPEPDIFLYAAQKMRVPPAQCIVIEDSLRGVRAALSANMRVIFYDPEGLSSPTSNPRIQTIAHMSEADIP